MELSRLLKVTLCVVPLIGLPTVTHAIDLHVEINGTTVPCASGATICDISGTYPSSNAIIDVSGYDPGATPPTGSSIKPTVELMGDGTSLPELKLKNAKFKATANAVNGSVTFWTTPSTGRDAPKMQRVADGWLGRAEGATAPYTSSTNRGTFTVDGLVSSSSITPVVESIDGIFNGGDTAGSSKVVLNTAWSFGKIDLNLFTKNEVMGNLQGARDLKGEFTFYLPVTNDYLRLTQVSIRTFNPGGKEVDDAPPHAGYTDIVGPNTVPHKCPERPCITNPPCKGKKCLKPLEQHP